MPRRIDSRVLAYVAVGGTIGVFARAAIVAPLGEAEVVPWVTLAINAAGSLLLGVVVGWLGDRRPHVRAFLGTGVLGGFTTYSAFAVETAQWASTPLLALGLAAASVVGGVACAIVGLLVGRRLAGTSGPIQPTEAAE